MRTTAQLIVAALVWGGSLAMAQPPDLFLEHLAEFDWTGAVNNNWRNAGNWTAPVMPPPPAGVTFPNDPGRMDMDAVNIEPVVGADLSSALSSDLTVDINGGDVTVASLKLGGTAGAVTTDVTSSDGSLLILENFELNDEVTNPGDPFADPPIEPEPIYGFNQGNALIWSTGTAAEGEINRISADIKINDDVDVEGDRDLHIYGNVIETDPGAQTKESLSSFLTGGAWLHVHGDIQTTLFDEDGDETNGTQDRIFGLNGQRGIPVPEDFQDPPDPVTRQGNIDVHGQLVGEGRIEIGSSLGNLLPIGTVILRADNSAYTGRILLNRGNLVLDHNNALGTGDLVTSNPNQGLGFNFISTSDDRVIANEMQVAQWHTVRGASSVDALDALGIGDHSIEFSGEMRQTNSRGWINLLPYDYEAGTGPTLTLSGPQYPLEGGDNADADRLYTLDGDGKTIVTGGIHNRPPDGTQAGNGHLRKRGAGTVVIDFDESHATDSPTDYTGYTWMEGGNLHFATNDDLPNPGTVNTFGAEILSSGGAIGFDEGVFSANAGNFLSQLNNSSNPNFTPATSPPFMRFFGLNDPIFNRYDHGGLMLGADEYDEDLDFNSGSLANAANMTLAAWETNSTYTGTITPSTTVLVNPNTYQLGGGSGTLTLPNQNQLTGSRHLIVDNGGEVRLTNTNDYSGRTLIRGNFDPSLTAAARGNQPGADNNEPGVTQVGGQSYLGTTLSVSNLTDGASSIGTSTAAADLHIQGSTLKYEGAAVTTNRLFTVGTAGATLDASGTGAVNFSNTGALNIDVAEDRVGIVAAAVPGNQTLEIFGIPSFLSGGQPVVFDTSDLIPGMAVRALPPNDAQTMDDDDEILITGIPDPHAVTVAEADVDEDADPPEVPWQFPAATVVPTFDFGPAPARTFTLSGTNTGENTLAASIGDAPDKGEASAEQAEDGFGTVSVAKTGSGKWVLANANNTYTGGTVVEEGTLSAVSIGTGDLAVEAGGTIAPGSGPHTLVVGGDYTQEAGGVFQIQINGTGAGMFDVLDIAGDAVLEDGAVLDVVLGTSLSMGATFDILTASSITADANLLSLTGAAGFEASLAGGGTILQLAFTGSAGGVDGDYNGDGVVNAADYVVWRNVLANGGSLMNEVDNPGTVDQGDYDFWASRFGATSAAGNATTAVPEPASAVVVAVLLAGLLAMRKRWPDFASE